MMKKIVTVICMMTICAGISAQKPQVKHVPKRDAAKTKAEKIIELPDPALEDGMSLNEALRLRCTNREFSEEPLDMQMLSNLLWAANGVNREDGKRTAPTARNAQEIEVLVFIKEGLFLYDAKKNVLVMIRPEDVRAKVSPDSKMTMQAPVTLLFAANFEKMEKFNEDARNKYKNTDAGFVSQNVYLYCAANKLNTVVMGHIDVDWLNRILPFKGEAILAQPVGYSL